MDSLFAVLFAFSAPALADDWLVATVTSYHFATEEQFNQCNYGIGFEKGSSTKRLAVSAGEYRNSRDRTSVYAALSWTPIAVLSVAHVGLIGGVITGYPANPVLPMVLPTVQIEKGRFGVNLFYAPRIKDGAAVLGLQVKVVTKLEW